MATNQSTSLIFFYSAKYFAVLYACTRMFTFSLGAFFRVLYRILQRRSDFVLHSLLQVYQVNKKFWIVLMGLPQLQARD